MVVPLLPESAPFSGAQRAWLNGFFAGLLNFDANGHAGGFAGAGAASAVAPLAPPEVEEEEFPWHDPTLDLDERLTLAEGKPTERKLMAAMAQLDCGACGYLCQTYSEAIARGEEKDLNKCTPGGKPTARKLKELVAAGPANGADKANGTHNGNGAAAKANGVVAPAKSTYNRTNPFPAKLLDCRPLNRPGSVKDTRHVMISLAGSGLTYEPGDALGVFPENCPELADEILAALGAAADEPLPAADGSPRRLRDALIQEYALARPSADLIELLAGCAADPVDAQQLKLLIDNDEDEWIETADVVDLLNRFPSARPPAEAFLRSLAKLQPRLYSISSSLRAHPEEVHLTVGVVRYEHGSRKRKGVASTFLADRLTGGGVLRVFIQGAHKFRLPDRGDTPVIMVGPGTGIAPFRAFLEERHAARAPGKNWLFFGDQCQATDFLYEEELNGYQKHGLLTRLDTAFSRDQKEKIYVQNRMLHRASDLWNWLEEGAHFYVCGDAKRMASDVDRALHEVVASQGGLDAAAAKAYVANLSKTNRYQRDVY